MTYNYKHGRKWVEIIRQRPKREDTTTDDIIRHEIEKAEEALHKVVVADVDNLVPMLRELLADEEKGITEYTKVSNLLFNISITADGMLDKESKEIKEILSDEIRHKKKLEEILKKLTY